MTGARFCPQIIFIKWTRKAIHKAQVVLLKYSHSYEKNHILLSLVWMKARSSDFIDFFKKIILYASQLIGLPYHNHSGYLNHNSNVQINSIVWQWQFILPLELGPLYQLYPRFRLCLYNGLNI